MSRKRDVPPALILVNEDEIENISKFNAIDSPQVSTFEWSISSNSESFFFWINFIDLKFYIIIAIIMFLIQFRDLLIIFKTVSNRTFAWRKFNNTTEMHIQKALFDKIRWKDQFVYHYFAR